jgi:hypothetical protein
MKVRKMTVKELAIEHPYYASDSNYYSKDAGAIWETMTEFLDEYEGADIDMNQVYRWDISSRSEDKENSAGRWYASVFIIHQRKGIYAPHYIKHINDVEADRFAKFLKKHLNNLLLMWKPFT